MHKKKLSITTRIIICLIALLAPFNILSLLISGIIISDSKNAIIDSINSTINTYANRIDLIAQNTDYSLYDLARYGNTGYTFFHETEALPYQLAKSSLFNTLHTTMSTREVADCYFFYRRDLDDLFISPHNSKKFDKFLEEYDFWDNKKQIENANWNVVEIEGTYYLVRMLMSNSTNYGAFIALDPILEDIQIYLNYPVSKILFSSEYLTSEKEFYVTQKCNNIDLYITLAFDKNFTLHSIAAWRWLILCITALYIILIPVIYHFIRKSMIQPLQQLNKAHLQIENGNQEYRITAQCNSYEFMRVYDSFNNMVAKLQKLRLENIDKELARKKMLIDNLQLQIRPHFLLNTFNLLYTMIQTQNTPAAKKMILYLSQYFRYLFQHTEKLVLFPKEFDLVQKYLEVSLYQAPDAFTFTYDFDPEINLVRVPPLMLLNFFENIISHALVHGREVHIMFHGSYADGLVTLQIADDGCGMMPEDVDQINLSNYDNYQRGSHVGLRNSIARLKYFYDNQATLHVESVKDEGTIFTITFPYNLECKEEIE